ncbi:hypothetical protein GCM10010302_75030 [Streptomyces polychromogenes]|uniref:Uncharacterized protein n=1 Tax=Streptomyces polychromogenes TaxID=67342 RepID=A0ABN0W4J6_9ACTN
MPGGTSGGSPDRTGRRALALAPGLRAELKHRGLLHEWHPAPTGAPMAGQTLGGTGPHAGLGPTAWLVVALPEALWARSYAGSTGPTSPTSRPSRPGPTGGAPDRHRTHRAA